MKFHPQLSTVILFASMVMFLSACHEEVKEKSESKENIQLVDFSKFNDRFSAELDEIEMRKTDSLIFEAIEKASLEKYLPQLNAKAPNGEYVDISKLIKAPTLILVYSPYCGWSSVDLAEQLPAALDGLENKPEVICLYVAEERVGSDLPENFFDLQQDQLKYLFPNFLIVPPEEAQKLNIYALPARYYFHSDGKLAAIRKGIYRAEAVKGLRREIKQESSHLE